jgi:hypothetical protein
LPNFAANAGWNFSRQRIQIYLGAYPNLFGNVSKFIWERIQIYWGTHPNFSEIVACIEGLILLNK